MAGLPGQSIEFSACVVPQLHQRPSYDRPYSETG
jgi:hypothetical protein